MKAQSAGLFKIPQDRYNPSAAYPSSDKTRVLPENVMAGPTTEVLNEDIKELKGDLRDIRSNLEVLKADAHRIDVSLAELRADFRRSNLDGLKADVHRIDVGLAELRFAKWLLGLLLAMTLTGIGGGIWWASKVDTKVDAIESRFDRLESSMAKILEQIRPAPAPTPITKPSPPKP